MDIIRIRTCLPLEEALGRAKGCGALAIDPSIVASIEEIELAAHLARNALSADAAISRSLRLETLLFLTGKGDIASAMDAGRPKGPQMIIISWDQRPDIGGDLAGAILPLGLAEKADWRAIERISLSRVRR